MLFTRFLKHNPADPTWPNRDRFVLSAGHGSALLYALLHVTGYPLSLEEIRSFRQWGSHTAGHPEYNLELGIETTTGPLGQGIGNAVGMALAERWLAARYNRPGFDLVDHTTYVLASDGDLMEGISHEVASFAGHLGLGKLIVLFDDNHISIDGPTELTCTDDVLGRFEAYGWHTLKVDGHDMGAIDQALRQAQSEDLRPSLIACRTHIGLKSPFQDDAKVHGSPLGEERLARTKKAYGWPVETRFHVPAAVREELARYQNVWQQEQAAWEDLLKRYREVYPSLAADWDLVTSPERELPEGWDSTLPDFTGTKPLATRAASGKVLDAISPRLPMLLGGSADLTGSNKTRPADSVALKRHDFQGNYIHFGVREHGMGAILNGLALHGGVRPYGGTFLVFSDYLRPSIRLAAMMNVPVIYVFSHDSIGLGEDGPTHQPIEHLAALRSIPNLVVIRPADGNETAQAWRATLERTDGPTALALTRQGIPQVSAIDNGLASGAYVLADSQGGTPEVVVIASGSEVSLALKARRLLKDDGVLVRVVSMPSWELFDAQPLEYRESVLPPGVPCLSIEAGVTMGWSRYVGREGVSMGIDRYGASAPYQTIYQQFGLTAERVAEQVRALLGSHPDSKSD